MKKLNQTFAGLLVLPVAAGATATLSCKECRHQVEPNPAESSLLCHGKKYPTYAWCLKSRKYHFPPPFLKVIFFL